VASFIWKRQCDFCSFYFLVEGEFIYELLEKGVERSVGLDLKVFENEMRAIVVYFELGEPWWFRLIDLRSNRTLFKDFVRNRAKLHRYKHVKSILAEFEEWLEKWRKHRGRFILPPSNSAPPI